MRRGTYRCLKGVSAARGVAIGKAFIHSKEAPQVSRRRIPAHHVEAECERFLQTLRLVADEIRRTSRLVEVEHGSDLARIFEAQLAMVEDVEVRDQTLTWIRQKNYSAEYAFSRTLQQTKKMFERVENEYLRARLSDIIDIEHQVLVRLAGGELRGLQSLRTNTVVIAHDLLPSEAVQLERRQVKGLVTELGGTTSHTSIIARSMGLPAVVGAEDALQQAQSGDLVIVDGDEGQIHLCPDAEIVRAYRNKLRRQRRRQHDLSLKSGLPAVTRDGHRIALMANIDLPSEVDTALKNGASGVGMYRTEFLFLGYTMPSEKEQLKVYRRIVGDLAPRPVTIRTLDLGGDKLAHVFEANAEANPFLGWRGIRLCLDEPAFFKAQLRALLRAGSAGSLRLMLPMVTTLDEVRQARRLLAETRDELAAEGHDPADACRLGIMVEVPAVALMIERFAEEVDFCSLGTNDLIQYALAVDRGNAKVADLYDPYHPAVLRLIKMVADACKKSGLPLSICGEMAGDPQATPLLLGLGLAELSLSPALIPEVKETIRSLRLADAQDLADACLQSETSTQVRRHLDEAAQTKR